MMNGTIKLLIKNIRGTIPRADNELVDTIASDIEAIQRESL
jgi:hypothetical protein